MKSVKLVISKIVAKAGNNGMLVAGTLGAQLLALIASPLITRMYHPDDFGILASYTSVLLIFSVVASFGYDLAIPLPEKNTEAKHLVVLSVILSLGFAGVVSIVLWTVPGARNLLPSQIEPAIWVIPLGVLAISTYNIFSYWAIRAEAFKALAQTHFLQSMASVTVQVSAGLMGANAMGLIAGQILGHSAGIRLLSRSTVPLDSAWLQRDQFKAIRRIAIRYRNFALYGTPANLLNRAGLLLPPLLIASVYDLESAGYFALGERIIRTPLSAVGGAFSKTFLSQASKLMHISPKSIRSLFLRVSRNLLFLGAIPIFAVAAVSPSLFAMLFGDTWRTSGEIVQLLALFYAVQFVCSPLGQVLNILERQYLLTILDGIRVILVIGVFAFVDLFELSLRQALVMYSAAMTVMYLVTYSTSLLLLMRLQARHNKLKL